MPRRPYVRVEALQERWRESPLYGGLIGILSVTVATLALGLVCALIALIVTLIF